MIYLISPDNSSVHGGIKIINQHALLLSRNGREVRIVDPAGKIADWLDVPFQGVVRYDYAKVKENDTIVVYWNGERDIDIAFSQDAKRFFVALNTQPPSILEEHPYLKVENDTVGEEVFVMDWDEILCTTEELRDICREYDKEPTMITVGIDTDLFKPSEKKKNTVAYFTRRGDFVTNNREFLEKLGLILVPIQDCKEREVAEILSTSEFFLSITTGVFFNCKSLTGKPRPAMEGWNMPVHEAMACGCAVIGYKAHSAPFMNDETAWVVPDYDEEKFREKIKECLESERTGKVESGIQEARKYSLDMMYETFAKAIGIWQPN